MSCSSFLATDLSIYYYRNSMRPTANENLGGALEMKLFSTSTIYCSFVSIAPSR